VERFVGRALKGEGEGIEGDALVVEAVEEFRTQAGGSELSGFMPEQLHELDDVVLDTEDLGDPKDPKGSSRWLLVDDDVDLAGGPSGVMARILARGRTRTSRPPSMHAAMNVLARRSAGPGSRIMPHILA
jgi:hypothetical protein